MFVNSILVLVSRSILDYNEDMYIYIYIYMTGSISVVCYRPWIVEMSETNKYNNIKGSSVKTDMANSRSVETSVAIVSQTGNYNFPYQLCKIYNI